jgi:hypothetical protein
VGDFKKLLDKTSNLLFFHNLFLALSWSLLDCDNLVLEQNPVLFSIERKARLTTASLGFPTKDGRLGLLPALWKANPGARTFPNHPEIFLI